MFQSHILLQVCTRHAKTYGLYYLSSLVHVRNCSVKKNKQTHTKSTGYRQTVLHKLASIHVISQVTDLRNQCCENLKSHNMDQVTFCGRFLI